MYNFHFRQYDPTTGVWTSPDPIGILGGINFYGYAMNNPVNFVDWLGLHFGDSQSPGDHGDIGGSESNSDFEQESAGGDTPARESDIINAPTVDDLAFTGINDWSKGLEFGVKATFAITGFVAKTVAFDIGFSALEAVGLGPALIASRYSARAAGILSNLLTVSTATKSALGWRQDAKNLSDTIYDVKKNVFGKRPKCK